ncbi:MAG: hypothetical protein CBARDCOR_5000, partial [uncultured Caballeronia sp.]
AENWFDLFAAPFSQESEPPPNSERFKTAMKVAGHMRHVKTRYVVMLSPLVVVNSIKQFSMRTGKRKVD